MPDSTAQGQHGDRWASGTNWAGNYTYRAARVHRPAHGVAELLENPPEHPAPGVGRSGEPEPGRGAVAMQQAHRRVLAEQAGPVPDVVGEPPGEFHRRVDEDLVLDVRRHRSHRTVLGLA